MNGRSKAHVFLIEIMIVILFFSIATAVTLRLFVYANEQSQNSLNINEAVVKVQNIAEAIKAADSLEDDWLAYCEEPFMKTNEKETDTYLAYYDEDWLPVTVFTDRYVKVIILQKAQTAGTMVTANIECSNAENNLYNLQVKKYIE